MVALRCVFFCCVVSYCILNPSQTINDDFCFDDYRFCLPNLISLSLSFRLVTPCRGSINAQKHSDEYNRPNTFSHLYYLQDEPRQAAYNVYSNMSSYFKGRQGGAASSFHSVRFYNQEAKNKRAAMLAKYDAEAALAAQS